MTDIPLRPLGRSKQARARDGYAQLRGGDEDEDAEEDGHVRRGNSSRANGHGRGNGLAMPAARKNKIKQSARSRLNVRRDDDGEEEEEALLAGHDGDEGYDEERQRGTSRTQGVALRSVSSCALSEASVCRLQLLSTIAIQRSSDTKSMRSILSRDKNKDKSRDIPFRPSGMSL